MRAGMFHHVRTYIVAIAVAGIAAALVSTIFFTENNPQWTTFLAGILVASVLAEAVRASRTEWALMRRTAQLSATKDKLEREASQRKRADIKVTDAQMRLHLVDEVLLTMVVLVDPGGYCRYHNRAFRDWLHMKAESIDGRHLRELLGAKAYAGIATAVRQSLDGQSVHYEHLQEMAGGAVYKLSVEHVPQFDAAGQVTGFYLLAEDITRRGDLSQVQSHPVIKVVSPPENISGQSDYTVQDMYLDDFSGQVGGGVDAGKQFISAILSGEFRLYCQLISPLDDGKTVHYEILIRLMEEEGGLIPPGAFFPLAERNGLMPYLDRWVVQHVLQWAANTHSRDSESIFFINVAQATTGDPEFPGFLKDTLDEYGMSGSALCFEIAESDLAARSESVADFVRQVRLCGCLVALSGFGHNGVSFDKIRGFQVDFLKIDGATIINMLGNPVDLAKVVSIDRVAKKIGVKTVAEMVESDEIVAKLRELRVDFAQGFGISRPRRLME